MFSIDKAALQSIQIVDNNQEGNWGDQALPLDLLETILLNLNRQDLQKAACLNKYWNDKTIKSVKAHKAFELFSQIAKINHDLIQSNLFSEKTTENVKLQTFTFLEDAKIAKSQSLKEVKNKTIYLRKKLLETLRYLLFYNEVKILPAIKVDNCPKKIALFTKINDENLGLLANEFANFGRFAQAIEKIKFIKSDDNRVLPFFHILKELIERNKFNEFFELLSKMPNDPLAAFHRFYNDCAWIKLPHFLANLTSDKTIQFSNALDVYDSSNFIDKIILHGIKLNDQAEDLNHFNDLIKTANLISDSNRHQKFQMLKAISLWMLNKNFTNEANKLKREIFEKDTLVEMADELCFYGYFDEATAIANAIPYSEVRENSLLVIEQKSSTVLNKNQPYVHFLLDYSKQLATEGFVKLALMLAYMNSKEVDRDTCLMAISIIFSKNGNDQAAIDIASTLPGHLYKSESLGNLAIISKKLILNDFADKAYDIVNYITDERSKVYLLNILNNIAAKK